MCVFKNVILSQQLQYDLICSPPNTHYNIQHSLNFKVKVNNSSSFLYQKDIPQYYTHTHTHTHTAEPGYNDIQFMQHLIKSVKLGVFTYLGVFYLSYML